MKFVELQAAITEVIDDHTCSAEFFFVLKSGDRLVIKRPDMDQDAQTELSSDFILSIRNSIVERSEISLLDLTNADGRSDVIYRYDLDELPAQLQSLNFILVQEIKDVFDFKTDSLKDLDAILVLIGNQSKQIAVYKHHYPVTLMQKNSGFSIVKSRERNRFEKLDEDILKVNSKFEFFMFDGQCYILDVATLERFYGFSEAIKNVASKALRKVSDSGLLVDVDVLATRLNDLAFCRKLARLAMNSPVLGVVPNEKVIAFAINHPKLSGKFTLSDDGTKFNLKTKVSQNLFLKLLNDDYLKSLLTETDYESLAKDSIEVEVMHAVPAKAVASNVLQLISKAA